jgi:decaprenylphospho-beta-D-erythro-pentofuranosid-2-ulose 2-reductase
VKSILIIGATSAIAEHCARIWAARGDQLFLVARNKERLEAIATDLQVRGGPKVSTHSMDVNDFARHTAMLDQAEAELNGIDTVLIAHGTLSNQKLCEQNVELTMQEIKTNALSVIALLTQIANRFEATHTGTIAVISSVAGERGRQSNYVYGSAKAMVTAFTSGLRQRLHRSGISVITIKPGFVDTPMTKEHKKGFLWAAPMSVAATIVKALDKKRDVVYVPWFWWGVISLTRMIPEVVFRRISL